MTLTIAHVKTYGFVGKARCPVSGGSYGRSESVSLFSESRTVGGVYCQGIWFQENQESTCRFRWASNSAEAHLKVSRTVNSIADRFDQSFLEYESGETHAGIIMLA